MFDPDTTLDKAIANGWCKAFRDEAGEERIELTEAGFGALAASFTRRGMPIPWTDGPGYRITRHGDGRTSIMCKTCHAVSCSARDVQAHYCGRCQRFHGDALR